MKRNKQSVSQTPLFYYYHLLMNHLKSLTSAQGSEENSAAVQATVRPDHQLKRGMPIKFGRMERDASR